MAHQSRFLLVMSGLLAIWIAHVSQAAAAPNDDWVFAEPFSIVTNAANQDRPTADGDIVAWRDYRNSSSVPYLYGKNLSSGSEQQLSTYPLSKYMSYMDMKGGTLTYQADTGSWLLCTRNLALDPANLTAAPENCIATSTAYGISISQSGNRVIFGGQEYTNGIRVADFDTGQVDVLDTNTYGTNSPYANRDMGFWQSQMGFEGRYYEYVIMKRPLDGSLPVNNVTGRGCADGPPTTIVRAHPRAAGDMVVFARKNNPNGVITDYNIAIPTVAPDDDDKDLRCNDPLVVDEPYDQQNPEITEINVDGVNHHLVVWEDNRNGNWDVYAKDLENNQEVPICVCPGDQRYPDVTVDSSGKPFIVWQDNRNGNWDIYGAKATRAQELADRYAPHLYLHHEEYFQPRKIDIMVGGEGTQLRARNGTNWDDLILEWPDLTLDSLGQYNTESDQPSYSDGGKYIDLPGNLSLARIWPTEKYLRSDYVDRYNSLINTNSYPETTYAHVVKNTGNGQTVIQYWLPYYFDNWNNYHEGDWEHIDVILNGNLDPIYAGYSQHDTGQRRPWAYIAKPDSHPIVYVARGSHANYFYPGPHDAPLFYTDDTKAHELHQPSVTVLPDVSSLDLASLAGSPYYWLAYQGAWGELTSLPEGNGSQGPAANPEHNSVWDDPFSWFNGLCWDGSDSCDEEPRAVSGSVHSPVDIHLYDSQGRHVGKNDAGGIDEQIPGAEYIEIPDLHEKTITVHEGDGTEGYRFVLKGNGTGTFDFTVTSPDRAQNSVDTIKHLAVPVTTATTADILLDQNKNYSLEIDNDGDGTIDEQRQPDSVVTQAVDLTPPAKVTDLSVTNASSGTATLAFTAPGDDGNAGTAQYYDIRYSTVPITEDNWKEAMPLAEIPVPSDYGDRVTATATGLSAGTTCYFALEARDETLQPSELSNVAVGITTIPNLTWSKQRVYWASWAEYQNRHLSIDYRMTNTATGIALESTVQASLCNPGTVYIVTQLPYVVGDSNPGSNRTVTLKYFVPTNVGSFTTITYTTCNDDAGRTYWFPGPL